MPDGSNYSPEQPGSKAESKWSKLKTVAKKKVGSILQRGQKSTTTPPTPSQTHADIPTHLSQPPDRLSLPPEFTVAVEPVEPLPLPAEFPEDPSQMFQYLQTRNPQFHYEKEFTPEEMAKAVAFARSRGLDPAELSPAQILFASVHDIAEPTPAETSQVTVRLREAILTAHQTELLPILLPLENTQFHATSSSETADSIMENGLYCRVIGGLSGVAVPLRKPKNDSETEKTEVITNNIRALSNSHRGHRYAVVINLPELSKEQSELYRTSKTEGENRPYTSFFVKPLQKPVGAPGASLMYDAVLPPEYISGYLDLNTAEFHPKRPTNPLPAGI